MGTWPNVMERIRFEKRYWIFNAMHDKHVGPLGFHPWKHNGPFDGIQDWMVCVWAHDGFMLIRKKEFL